MIAKTLQKKNGTGFEDIAPYTGAECVTYNASTVKDELDYILSMLGSMISSSDIDAKIAKACSDLYDKVLGTTDHASVNSAYDTLKEVADYLDAHGNVVKGIQSDITNLRDAINALAPIATSGSYNDLTDKPSNATTSADGYMSKEDKAKLDTLSGSATKVEASNTNGNIKINGVETNVYTLPALSPADVQLGNVGNFKAVSTVAGQGLSDAEQAAARANIGAGSAVSAFSGDYNDLTNKPVNATTSADGYMSKEDKAKLDGLSNSATKVEASTTNGNIKINGAETNVYTLPTLRPADVQLGNVGNFKAVSTVANQGLTEAEKAAARANIGAGASASAFSGSYNDLTDKPSNATQTSDGFMSKEDKTTLDNLSTKSTNVSQSTVNGNILVDGQEVTVYTPDPIPDATTSASGLMSAADKIALDNLAANGVTTSMITKSSTNGNITVNGTDIVVYEEHEATSTEAGLMSAADKTKLDGLGTEAGKYSTPTAIKFTNSTYYSLDSTGVNKKYVDNGIVFVCMKITCNKLVVPQADTTVATLWKPVVPVEFDNLPATNETQYPPINIKITEDGELTILGGASGCTYNVYIQYGYSKDNDTTTTS